MSVLEFLKLFPKAFNEWVHDRADGLAASIAFYQLMSIAPLVALIVLASSAIFGHEQSKTEVEPLIGQFFHPQFINAMKYMLQYSFKLDESKLFTITILAGVSLVHGTFGYFEQVKDSIETFWDKRTEETTIRARLKKKLEAVIMASVIMLFLLLGFVAGHWFSGSEGVFHYVIMRTVEFITFFAIIYFLLTYCPPAKINWKDAIPGALLTTVLYMIGRLILAYILNHKHAGPEDVAATLILYLLWAYYSSLVFLYGAEFGKLYIEKKRRLNVNQMKGK